MQTWRCLSGIWKPRMLRIVETRHKVGHCIKSSISILEIPSLEDQSPQCDSPGVWSQRGLTKGKQREVRQPGFLIPSSNPSVPLLPYDTPLLCESLHPVQVIPCVPTQSFPSMSFIHIETKAVQQCLTGQPCFLTGPLISLVFSSFPSPIV